MYIMVSGPYHGASNDPEVWESNLKAMNKAAYHIFEMGHIPVIGVNNALPIIDVAGAEYYDSLMMPISIALAERCDAVLRIGGESAGADKEVARFQEKNLPVYYSISEIPAG